MHPVVLYTAGCFFLHSDLHAQHEALIKDSVLAKPNYSFQKRQKELAKKKKKEEKKQRKQEKQNNPDGEQENPLLAKD
jgi:hypothetical protein